jgi:hypothetical protein
MIWAFHQGDLFLLQFLGHGESRLAHGSILTRAWDEAARMVGAYHRSPLLLAAYFAGTAYLLLTDTISRRARWWIGGVAGIPLLFNTAVMVKGAGFYHLHPVIGLALGAGGVAFAIYSRWSSFGAVPRFLTSAIVVTVGLNLLSAGIVGRWITLGVQWTARDYETVGGPLRGLIPQGAIVWGPPQVWYAVVDAGAELRLLGSPDPTAHDIAITARGTAPPTGFHQIGHAGHSLAPTLGGNLTGRDTGYDLDIYRARGTDAPPDF